MRKWIPAMMNRRALRFWLSADARTTPTITWPTPDPITYGDKLTFAQLNATASVEGTLVYTPGPGYVLPVGTHTLWVTFTPADSGTLRSAAGRNFNCCGQGNAGPHLANTCRDHLRQRIGRCSTQCLGAGTWKIRLLSRGGRGAASGNAYALGNLHPRGQRELRHSTGHRVAHCGQGNVCHPMAEARSDYIRHHSSATRNSVPTASVPGTFEYNPGSGAVLAAGEHRLSVVFTPADTSGYSASQAAVSLTVAKATPAITWPTPDPIAYGAALSATQLNAAATVPGSFAYTPAAGEILEPGVHELSVNFTPTDTLNYTSARAVVPLTVTEKLSPLITWPVPSAISYGTALNATQLNATASVPGTFVYTPSAGHVLAPGRYTLSASFTPLDAEKYATAQATVVLEVEGSPDNASLPTAATETPSTRTFTAIDSDPCRSGAGGSNGRTHCHQDKPPRNAHVQRCCLREGRGRPMASPEKIAPLLPETLPEDFSDWDSETSPVPVPGNSGEWEAWETAHSSGKSPRPLVQSADRDAILESLLERPHVSGSASSAPVFVKQQRNFIDWESEESPTATPVNRSEWEAWEAAHSSGKTPKPLGQSADRDAILESLLDRPRVSGSASPAPVSLKPQKLTSELVDVSPSRASHTPDARRTTNEVPVAPSLPNAAPMDGMTNSPELAATLRREADEALFQMFRSKNIEVKGEQKTPRKK